MFRATHRSSSGAQKLYLQLLVLHTSVVAGRCHSWVRTQLWQHLVFVTPLVLPVAIAAGSTNGGTNTRCCRYSCLRSWWWVVVPPEHVEQFPDINKLCNVAACWTYIGIFLRRTDTWTLNVIYSFWIYHFCASFSTLFYCLHWKYICFCDKLTVILKSSASTLTNARTQSKAVATTKPAWIRAYLKNYIRSVSQDTLCFLTLRRLMSYIYGAPILDVSRSHTTTQHSR